MSRVPATSPVGPDNELSPADIARLIRNERMFRARFDAAHLPQLVVDFDGVMTEVNDAFCRLLGRSRQDLVGARVHDLRHASEQPSQGNPIAFSRTSA